MGKASRRKQRSTSRGSSTDPAQQRAPFAARPFEGLPAETEWVAMRELIPAATATIRFTPPAAGGAQDGTDGIDSGGGGAGAGTREATVATVLPMAWPALHRSDGQLMVALQAGSSSGDASRDVAQALLEATGAEAGNPVTQAAVPTAATPRLQDLLAADDPFEVEVHDGFGFWIGDEDLDAATQASLERANESAVPTVGIGTVPSAYWCRIGDRCYIRWVLPEDEDAATTAFARLQAADEHTLGADTSLLGAFRASGLLVPVLEVDPQAPAEDHGPAMAELAQRYAQALTVDTALSADERRARDGLISRQVTLR